MWWLEHCGENDYRLFDSPRSDVVGCSYDFTSLHDALIYAKIHNLTVVL